MTVCGLNALTTVLFRLGAFPAAEVYRDYSYSWRLGVSAFRWTINTCHHHECNLLQPNPCIASLSSVVPRFHFALRAANAYDCSRVLPVAGNAPRKKLWWRIASSAPCLSAVDVLRVWSRKNETTLVIDTAVFCCTEKPPPTNVRDHSNEVFPCVCRFCARRVHAITAFNR